MSWVLYGTEGCHLCEHAFDLCLRLQLRPKQLDIMDDQHLLERYRVKIPVLAYLPSSRCLDWPFSELELNDFIKDCLC